MNIVVLVLCSCKFKSSFQVPDINMTRSALNFSVDWLANFAIHFPSWPLVLIAYGFLLAGQIWRGESNSLLRMSFLVNL